MATGMDNIRPVIDRMIANLENADIEPFDGERELLACLHRRDRKRRVERNHYEKLVRKAKRGSNHVT